MIDPITNIHWVTDEPNMYKRESTRIDSIFWTIGISWFISQSGILPFDYIPPSDHRGLFIDTQLTLYLQDPIYLINDASSRLLSISNSKGFTVYKKNQRKHILKNNIIKSEYKIFRRQGYGGNQQHWRWHNYGNLTSGATNQAT